MGHFKSAKTRLLRGNLFEFFKRKSKKSVDYDKEMKSDLFLDWFEPKVFPKLKQLGKKVVLVLDRATYHADKQYTSPWWKFAESRFCSSNHTVAFATFQILRGIDLPLAHIDHPRTHFISIDQKTPGDVYTYYTVWVCYICENQKYAQQELCLWGTVETLNWRVRPRQGFMQTSGGNV